MRVAPESYPPPPWRLRHATLGSISFWEVAPEMFIGADSFVEATNSFLEGKEKPVTFDKLKEAYSMVDVLGIAPLRDFGRADFEVAHGWLVYNENGREAATEDFNDAGGDPGGVGKYGRNLTDSWSSLRATGVAPHPRPVDAPESAGDSLASSPNRYKSRKTGEFVWEVEPDRFIYGTSEQDAKRRFTKYGSSATFAKGSRLHTDLDLVPDSSAKPQHLRRFRDKEGDIWLLLEEHLKLYCGTDEDEARDHPDDADSIDHAFIWAPFTEIDLRGDVMAMYDTAEELLSELQTTVDPMNPQPSPEETDTDEEAPTMTTATRKPPPFVHYVSDQDGRNWFEVHDNRYVLTDPMKDMPVPEQAGDAWNRFAARGYEESSYGRSLSSINSSFGPVTEKGFTEVKAKEQGFTQDDLLGKAVSHDRCSCTKLDDREEEQAKQFRLGANTFCIDCGKLRP
jgi:hypothetical protein